MVQTRVETSLLSLLPKRSDTNIRVESPRHNSSTTHYRLAKEAGTTWLASPILLKNVCQ